MRVCSIPQTAKGGEGVFLGRVCTVAMNIATNRRIYTYLSPCVCVCACVHTCVCVHVCVCSLLSQHVTSSYSTPLTRHDCV